MVTASTIDERIKLEQQFSNFESNPIQTRILTEAGISSPEDPRFRDMIRASVDFCYHAELYLPDPGKPHKPLHLEKWQYEELKYAQYGEAYIAKKAYSEGLIKKFLPHQYFDKKGKPVRKKVAINSPRGFGKSVYSTIVPIEFCTHYPDTLVALFSTSQDQADDLMNKIKHFLNNSILAFMIDKKNNSKSEIGLINGCRIKAFPQSEKTIRGFHPHIKIIDEKARIEQVILESAIRPMGRKSCWLEIGISTPFGRNNNHYKDCHDTKNFHIRLLNATEVSWVDLEKLAEEMAVMGERIAQQELFGEFLEDATAVFKPSHVARMYDYKIDPNTKEVIYLAPKEHGEPGVRYYMGADFGKNHDYSAFCIVHERHDGKIIIDHLERHTNMDYTEVVAKIYDLTRLFNVVLLVPDGKGVGIAVVDMIRKSVKVPIYTSKPKKKPDQRGKKPEDKFGFILSNNTKLNLVTLAESVVETGYLKSPYHFNVDEKNENNPLHIYKVLENEMLNFEFVTSPNGNVIFSGKKGGKKHDDTLIAVMFAIWGVKYKKAQQYALAGKKSVNSYSSNGRYKIKRY
jgi:hypothetical protein